MTIVVTTTGKGYPVFVAATFCSHSHNASGHVLQPLPQCS